MPKCFHIETIFLQCHVTLTFEYGESIHTDITDHLRFYSIVYLPSTFLWQNGYSGKFLPKIFILVRLKRFFFSEKFLFWGTSLWSTALTVFFCLPPSFILLRPQNPVLSLETKSFNTARPSSNHQNLRHTSAQQIVCSERETSSHFAPEWFFSCAEFQSEYNNILLT